jgi:hypothetical protein
MRRFQFRGAGLDFLDRVEGFIEHYPFLFPGLAHKGGKGHQ